MGIVERFHSDKRILLLVFCQIQCQLPGNGFGVYLAGHTGGSFADQGQHGIVHIIVNKDQGRFGLANQFTGEMPGIVYLPFVK